MELLYFGYSSYVRTMDDILEDQGLGRAHQRAMYLIGRQPMITVGDLIGLLGITKQSLSRVLNELGDRGLVEICNGPRDRRQRLLSLTPAGKSAEAALYDAGRRQMSRAYARAGQEAVSGFWAVLEGLIPEQELADIVRLGT